MKIFDFGKRNDIHGGLQEYRQIPGAVLLDVRTPEEYRQGHIPGSANLPLQRLDNADEIIDNEDTPVFVYCRSGARSRQAVSILKSMGYVNAKNIGGIAGYSGKVERSL